MHFRSLVCFALLGLVFSVPVQAGSLVGSFVQVADDITTNPLIFDGPFDVWHFVLESDFDVVTLEMAFLGQDEFINTTNADFIDQGDLVNGIPQVLGMDAPGTAFVVAPGIAEIAVGTENTPSRLTSSWTVDTSVLDAPLVPSDGTPTPVAVFGVAGDSPLAFDPTLVDATAFFRGFDASGSPMDIVFDDPPPQDPPVGIDAEVLADVGKTVLHQFQATDEGDPNCDNCTWSNLVVDTGSPFNAPTLNPDGSFSWDTSGSAYGLPPNGLAYEFTATVTDPDNLTGTATLTVNLIPEPASLAMIGLAMLGLGFIRRR